MMVANTLSTDPTHRICDALWHIYHRPQPPPPPHGAANFPWDDPNFSERMLREHLDQSHGAASRPGMEILRPLLSEADTKGAGTLVLGTVEGDLHDIGKNLVGMMFEGAGFNVVNLGIDLKPQVFVDAVKEHKPDLLGMSALLTTTMPKMGETINALKEAGLRDTVKVLIGGAPVTAEFAEEIGADAYAANAASSVDKARAVLG